MKPSPRPLPFAGAGLVAVASAVFLAACFDGLLYTTDGTLQTGTWGGSNAGVIVADSVTHVHIGCTFGDVAGPIELDSDGRFTINGTYVLRAYPVVTGPSLPAQFSGQVTGRTLTLAVAVNDTVDKKVVALGPVTVIHGEEPQLGPCPICRIPGMR